MRPKSKCVPPKELVDWLKPKLAQSVVYKPDVENLVAVYFDARERPIGWDVISTGSDTTALCPTKEIFKSAIIAGAYEIILCHNHPIGCACASTEDMKALAVCMMAGRIVGIPVIDNVIISGTTCPEHPCGYSSVKAALRKTFPDGSAEKQDILDACIKEMVGRKPGEKFL